MPQAPSPSSLASYNFITEGGGGGGSSCVPLSFPVLMKRFGWLLPLPSCWGRYSGLYSGLLAFPASQVSILCLLVCLLLLLFLALGPFLS
jgi:hypothetical protein